jgi:hypothetical protein
MNREELEKLYLIYLLDEVGHNTMTRGEFEKKLETDKEFRKRFIK